MPTLELTAAGPSLCVGGVEDGAIVSVVLSGGAELQMSRNLVQWHAVTSSSKTLTIRTPDGKRAVLRFNLPEYSGTPVQVSVEVP